MLRNGRSLEVLLRMIMPEENRWQKYKLLFKILFNVQIFWYLMDILNMDRRAMMNHLKPSLPAT